MSKNVLIFKCLAFTHIIDKVKIVSWCDDFKEFDIHVQTSVSSSISKTRSLIGYNNLCGIMSVVMVKSVGFSFTRTAKIYVANVVIYEHIKILWIQRTGWFIHLFKIDHLLSIRVMVFRDWTCFVSPWTYPSTFSARLSLCIRNPIRI